MLRPKLTHTLLTEPDYETDLLIIGGGGAGCWAAITAARKGKHRSSPPSCAWATPTP